MNSRKLIRQATETATRHQSVIGVLGSSAVKSVSSVFKNIPVLSGFHDLTESLESVVAEELSSFEVQAQELDPLGDSHLLLLGIRRLIRVEIENSVGRKFFKKAFRNCLVKKMNNELERRERITLMQVHANTEKLLGDLSGVKGDLSGVKGDLSGVKGDLNDLKDSLRTIMKHLKDGEGITEADLQSLESSDDSTATEGDATAK